MNRLLRQVPNMLSTLRLVAAPCTAALILDHADGAAVCVFGLAGLSDALDGFLAKRFALTSRFGAWLDPAADKLLMLASFVTLTMIGAVPFWLTALVIGRDAAIVTGVLLARLMDAPLQIAPLLVGKASTVVQVAYIALVLILLALNMNLPRIVFTGVVMVAALTLLSFFAYAHVWLQAVAAGRRAAQ
ncbi:MAG: CDP-alcohol phosphatidyltransferase family protein [Alphaproteobacteria bacterium]|nr:CDP-alcohol phosphatidyltransferase family protein [Alphaproteobacteria bacterium]MDE2494864.1 CDP-alcohol phosphatidyltransferase family protein [Alphaproteobacteria bacterium]